MRFEMVYQMTFSRRKNRKLDREGQSAIIYPRQNIAIVIINGVEFDTRAQLDVTKQTCALWVQIGPERADNRRSISIAF